MRRALPIFLVLLCPDLIRPVMARDWMGVRSKAAPAPRDTAAPQPARRKPDTTFLDLKVQHLPLGVQGRYLGTLEGVRCFNCEPNSVQLNIGDSTSMEATVITLR